MRLELLTLLATFSVFPYVMSENSGCDDLDTFIIKSGKMGEGRVFASRSVSSLKECLDVCKRYLSCAAIHFYFHPSKPLPICELLENRISLENLDQEQSITMYYGERVCLRDVKSTCESSWSFERVQNTRLQDIKSLATMILDTSDKSRNECLAQCLNTNACGAVTMSERRPTCKLLIVNRHDVRNPDDYFKADIDVDLYEKSCKPTIAFQNSNTECVYAADRRRASNGLDLFDRLVNKIATLNDCKEACLTSETTCRSYSFNKEDKACYLSHSTFHTLPTNDQWSASFSTDDNVHDGKVQSGELEDCVQFELSCDATNLSVTATTARMFRGHFGLQNSETCKISVDDEQRFRLTLDFEKCGIQKSKTGYYTAVVVLKYGTTQLITYRDRQLKLVCQSSNQYVDIPVSTQLHVKSANESIRADQHELIVVTANQPTAAGPATYSLRILNGNLEEISKVQLGDEGYLEIFEDSSNFLTHSIQITNLVASDLNNGEDIELLDNYGCPLTPSLIKPFESVFGQRKWRARIRFFGFNNTKKLHFAGLVKPCQGVCLFSASQCENGRKPFEAKDNIRYKRHKPMEKIDMDHMSIKGEAILLNPPAEETHSADVIRQHTFESHLEINNHRSMISDDFVQIRRASAASSLGSCFTDNGTCLLTLLLAVMQAVVLVLCFAMVYYWSNSCSSFSFLRRTDNTQKESRPPQLVVMPEQRSE